MGKHILAKVDCFISRSGGESFLVDPFGIKVVDGWNKKESTIVWNKKLNYSNLDKLL